MQVKVTRWVPFSTVVEVPDNLKYASDIHENAISQISEDGSELSPDDSQSMMQSAQILDYKENPKIARWKRFYVDEILGEQGLLKVHEV